MNRKIIKVPLSVNNLKELSKKIKKFSSNIKSETKEMQKDLIENGYQEIQKGYASSPYEGYEEKFYIKKHEKRVSVTGTQVLYREFGTGTVGASDPHPIKGNFSLNAYNSGKTIREAKENINPNSGISPGELYWTFYKNGVKYYTTGIPSGKEVYYAAKSTREKIKEIAKKRIGGAILKL